VPPGNPKECREQACASIYLPKLPEPWLCNSTDDVPEQGARLITALDAACEKDKGMSNLKGKAKEIKNIVSNI